jgi:hypothetical protein
VLVKLFCESINILLLLQGNLLAKKHLRVEPVKASRNYTAFCGRVEQNAFCLLRFRLVGLCNFAFKGANINTAAYALSETRGKVFAEPTKKNKLVLQDGLYSRATPLMRFSLVDRTCQLLSFCNLGNFAVQQHSKTQVHWF